MFKDIPEDDFYRYQDNLDPDAQQGAVIKKRLEELRGEQTAGFYRPDQRVTHTDTKSTVACSKLEQPGCPDCGATYGHTIKCPTFDKDVREELRKSDEFFLRSLRIVPFN